MSDKASPLSESDIARILERDNGPLALLELSRQGRISPSDAVDRINSIKKPFWTRVGTALLKTLFP